MSGLMEKTGNLRQTIEDYCSVSRQRVNYQKSSMYFNHAADEGFKSDIVNVFNVQRVPNPGHYLGLLTIWGRIRRHALKYLKERIRDKMHNWRNQLLNNASKEGLRKAVVTALTTYVMPVFKLPTSWFNEINSMVAKFWWGATNGERKIH